MHSHAEHGNEGIALTALATEDSESKLLDLGRWGVAFVAVFVKWLGNRVRVGHVLRLLPCRVSPMVFLINGEAPSAYVAIVTFRSYTSFDSSLTVTSLLRWTCPC